MKKVTHLSFNTLLLCLLTLYAVQSSSAQVIKPADGSLSALKGIKSYNIKFTYDDLVIGASTPEKEYLLKKQNDWDAKEQGKGSSFVSMWNDDREKLYHPAFLKSFEKSSGVKANGTEAKYTIILKTKRTEGGWNAGVKRHPAVIGGELWVVESANESNVIAKILFSEMEGDNKSGGDFEITLRIEAAYTTAGKKLGEYFGNRTK